MVIWVDADACPRVIRDILLRAAERSGIDVVFVANQALGLPPSPRLRLLRVPAGFDAADRRIEQEVGAGDLVITADIPLAAAVVAKGAWGLSPRGELYTADNVRQRLGVRDMMEELRDQRLVRGGPPALGARDRQAFANHLDRLLARHAAAAPPPLGSAP